MLTIFKKLMWFFASNKKKYAIAVVSLAVVNLFELIPPRMIGLAIDDIHTGVLTPASLMRYVAILVVAIVGSYVSGYVWRYQLFGGGFLLERRMRDKLMSHLLKMKPKFYQKYRTGDLMARATNDLGNVGQTAGYGILTLFDATFFMGVIVLMMVLTVNWQLTLIATLPLPIHAFLMTKLGLRADNIYDAAQEAFSDLNDQVLESITGVRVTRAYVREEAEMKNFIQMTEDVYEKNRHVEMIDSFWGPGTRILIGISFFLSLTFGAHLIFQGRMSVGDLISFNVYLGMLVWPMFAIGELISVMQRGKTSLERLDEVFAETSDVKEAAQPVKIDVPGEIRFKNLTFGYPNTKALALNNINLTIRRGETIGIVGKTGSGKTTLIRQLLFQYELPKQMLFVDGITIEQLDQTTALKWLGYVPQEHVLFSKSVRENILYGVREATEQRLMQIVKSAALTDDLAFFTDGLDTIVGEKGVALSGGQKQRISIARALATDPEILILDDSLSAVDAKTETDIVENIKRDRKGKTTLITAHRLSAVKHAQQIVVMDAGQIVQIGTHDTLMATGGWYKEQYVLQNLSKGLGGDHDEKRR